MIFGTAFFAIVAAATAATAAADVATKIVSKEEIMKFITTTNAELTFTGKPINFKAAKPDAALDSTVVVYCSSIVENSECGGRCSVYNGDSTCLSTPDTQCVYASANVALCNGGRCSGSCIDTASCRTFTNNGFCYSPGTESIQIL
ncbi:hypothetical protein CPC08DRAFT_766741 [Agrocybe pediades]|nr:hypothetical protein CPC08DRAFT_766741 [Agrocybe pediades]